MESDSLHVVMLPHFALGHLLPFFELAKRIAQLGHRVSFLTTAANIRRLAPAMPSPIIHLVDLLLPPAPGLPPTVQSTTDVPFGADPSGLYDAFDGCLDFVVSFLADASPPPDWLIYDCIPYWGADAAARAGVPCAYVGLPSAALHGFLGPPSAALDRCITPEKLTYVPDWVPFQTSVAFRLHEARQVFANNFGPHGASGNFRLAKSVERADVVGVRSCVELESEWLLLLRDIYRKPVIPVGLFPLTTPIINHGEWHDTVKWLDEQTECSVLYVACGSEVQLSREQVREIALGLELSELPFVWALKPPGPEMLPEGFAGRTRGRGVVCAGWVPQLEFLAHRSVGGFLTHCGWSSLVEALHFGVPLVLLPLLNDEGLNARLMAEKKVGVEVPRAEVGSFVAGDVAKTARLVVVEDDGEACRAKVKELTKVLGDQEVHDRSVRDFVNYLKTHRALRKRVVDSACTQTA